MTERMTKEEKAASVRKMLNDVAFYYKRSNALDVPEDLMSKLPLSLAQICRDYSG